MSVLAALLKSLKWNWWIILIWFYVRGKVSKINAGEEKIPSLVGLDIWIRDMFLFRWENIFIENRDERRITDNSFLNTGEQTCRCELLLRESWCWWWCCCWLGCCHCWCCCGNVGARAEVVCLARWNIGGSHQTEIEHLKRSLYENWNLVF